MRLLHVISSLDRRDGGPVTQLLGMAPAQVRCGIEVTILSTWSPPRLDDVADELRQHGCKVTLVGPAKTALQLHSHLRREVAAAVERADIVHIHALWEEIQHVAAREAHRRSVPYVITPHGMLDPWSLSQGKLKKRLYLMLRLKRDLNAAAAIHWTDEAEGELAAPLKLTPLAIVEPCCVDLAEFADLPAKPQMRAELLRRFPLIGSRPVICFLGRIHPKKGLDLLIPAFAKGHTRDAVLLIAGPDPIGYMAEVRRMIETHDLSSRVIESPMLTGRDRLAALAGADLFVLPSYQENFGIAVVEALAAGTPVIVSDRVNIHRHVSQAGVGAVCRPEVEPLAALMTQWMTDSALRAAASDKARGFVGQKYDQDIVARHWSDHYARLIRHPRASL